MTVMCAAVDHGRPCSRGLKGGGRGYCMMHYQRVRLTGTTKRGGRGTDAWEGTEFKVCRTCDEVKPRTEFGPNKAKRDGLVTHCKPCTRERHLRQKYGISRQDFDDLLAFQGGTCGLCAGAPGSRGWVVDHDHETGAVRGIVCDRCNLLFGFAGESADRLRAALRYLAETPATRLVRAKKAEAA